MRRLVVIAVISLAGCNAILDVHDYPAPIDAPDASPPDAFVAIDAASVCGGMIWHADFSTDPTALDDNNDGEPDWVTRNRSDFPTDQLVGGIWHAPATSQPLDTNPVQDFTTRTLIRGRMRGTDAGGGMLGAVSWVNVGYDLAGNYSPVVVDIRLGSDDAQTVTLFTKGASGSLVALVAQHVPTVDFIEFELDVDPTNLQARLTTGSVSGTYSLVQQPPNVTREGFASVLGYDTAAEIDEITIESCP